MSADKPADSSADPVVYAALVAHIEMLESENKLLKDQAQRSTNTKKAFRLEDIKDDNDLVCFYTGFVSFRIFEAFCEFLGPAGRKG